MSGNILAMSEFTSEVRHIGFQLVLATYKFTDATLVFEIRLHDFNLYY